MADQELLRKVRGLIAKAESTDNANERDAFMTGAQRIMDKHGLDERTVRAGMAPRYQPADMKAMSAAHEAFLQRMAQARYAAAAAAEQARREREQKAWDDLFRQPRAKTETKTKAETRRYAYRVGNPAYVQPEQVLEFMRSLGMTQREFAVACGVSSSLVSEWVGKGRGALMDAGSWAYYQRKARGE